MEIVGYDEKAEVLSLRFNTAVVWKYKNVNKKTYEKMLNTKPLEDSVRNLLHKPLIIGVHKEGDNELKI